MNIRTARLTEFEPSPYRPSFLHEIEARGDEIGFMHAVSETLSKSNVSVEVDGDMDQLREHDGGILFIGDHKNQWEFVALMDILSRMGRDDMLNIAKFYVQRQIHQSLGRAASNLVAPVYPRLLASDRNNVINSELINRIFYRRYLLSASESADANAHSLAAATDRLAKGGVVNIFPCGSVVDARTHPWRHGVGKIIEQLPPDARQDVLVAPYCIDDISRMRLVGAVALKGRGIFGRPQTMTVRLGPFQTTEELFDSETSREPIMPATITAELRERFVDHFGS